MIVSAQRGIWQICYEQRPAIGPSLVNAHASHNDGDSSDKDSHPSLPECPKSRLWRGLPVATSRWLRFVLSLPVVLIVFDLLLQIDRLFVEMAPE